MRKTLWPLTLLIFYIWDDPWRLSKQFCHEDTAFKSFSSLGIAGCEGTSVPGPTASFPHLQVQNADGKGDEVESEAVSTVLLVSWPYRILSRALRRRKESSISFSKGNMCTLRLACGRKRMPLKCISTAKTVKVMCLNAAIVPSPREWQTTCWCFKISCCWQRGFLFKGRKRKSSPQSRYWFEFNKYKIGIPTLIFKAKTKYNLNNYFEEKAESLNCF